VLVGTAEAADLSDADIAFKLRDYPKAFIIYKSFANNGSAEAQYKLAQLYKRGDGTPLDLNAYVEWCRRSAVLGNTSAQYDLGYLYTQGKLVPKDVEQAFHWIEKAAIAGQPNAQTTLGWSYMSNHLELPTNYALAMEWNLKAANQGNGEGAANVGLLHENGWGVAVNYKEAANWYIKAIEQNASSRQAYFHLARLYETGRGIEMDLVAAERLYQLIVSSGENEYSDEAGKRLVFIQGRQKLEELDEIKYPEEVVPRKGRRIPRNG